MRYRYAIQHFPGGIRICTYEKGIYTGKKQWDSRRKADLTPEERQEKDIENLKRSCRRTARKVEGIIRSNFYADPEVKMISLTFKRNEQRWNALTRCWKRFKDNYLHAKCKPLKYIAIVERQERGAFHLHAVLSFRFLDWGEMINAWRAATKEESGCWISKYSGVPEKAATYLTSYLTDEKYIIQQEFEKGKKRYFSNLKDHTRTTYSNHEESIEEIVRIVKDLDLIQAEWEYESETCGHSKVLVSKIPLADTEGVFWSCYDWNERILSPDSPPQARRFFPPNPW